MIIVGVLLLLGEAGLGALGQETHGRLLHRALSKVILQLLLFLLLVEDDQGGVRLVVQGQEAANGLTGYQTVGNWVQSVEVVRDRRLRKTVIVILGQLLK